MIPALTGILAPHGLATSFESIATVTVGAGGSSTFTFSSIPQTYTHLQVRAFAGISDSVDGSNWAATFQFNGDTSTNYSWHLLRGNGSTTQAYAQTNDTYIYGVEINAHYTNSALYGWGAGVIDILDYTSNKYKTTRTLTGDDSNNVVQTWVGLYSGLWRSTSAITSITFSTGKPWQQYSSFALYGVKA